MHPNEALARREIDLINAGDNEALEDLYTSDLVIHYPGKNPLSGSYPVQEFLTKFQALLGDGTLKRDARRPGYQ
jgi:ketosteroid isomerase-like protein